MTRAPWAIVDIDGVIADVRHRLRFLEGATRDWDGFFAAAVEDVPLEPGRAQIVAALSEGCRLAYLTGRPERCRRSTQTWLRDHRFPDGPLHMRGDHDRRPARIYKIDTLRGLAREAAIDRVIDDDPAVVRAMREAGFRVIHATWMSDAQEALLEAQESEGRT